MTAYNTASFHCQQIYIIIYLQFNSINYYILFTLGTYISFAFQYINYTNDVYFIDCTATVLYETEKIIFQKQNEIFKQFYTLQIMSRYNVQIIILFSANNIFDSQYSTRYVYGKLVLQCVGVFYVCHHIFE